MPTSTELRSLYDEHAQALFAFLLNLTRDEDNTHDVLQEVFFKLAGRPELLTGVREIRGFLIRLANNQAIDMMRRRETRQRNHDQFSADIAPLFESSPHADEITFRQAMEAALGELPADQRAVVHLKLWEEMTFDTIAATLDISPNTAASRYRYGIDKLRDRLRPLYEEINHHG